jgi:protein-disulfide isomerase
LLRLRFLTGLLLLSLVVGCRAQSTASSSPDSALNRRIEVMVRSQFGVPPYVDVTLSHGATKKVIDFLISTDNTKLARLETFDLSKDPVFNIDIAGRPIRGNPDAKVTVINFDDLECPYCARMHSALFPDTMDRYKDKVRFIYKDDPLVDLHPWAMHAAVDANCLAAQSGETYWKYVDYVHAHGQEVSGEDRNVKKSYDTLDRIAREEASLAKLDGPRLDACLAKQDETQERASAKEAEELGIDGTPALFIDGERINGALPADQIWMVIDRALRAAGIEPPPPPAPASQSAAKGK